MTGIAATHVSFGQASMLLQELAGLHLDPKQTERAAEALGSEIAEDEHQVMDVEPNSATTLYLGMDGTGIPMRASALQGRSGKQDDGSSKTREVKLVSVWSGSWCEERNHMIRDPHSVTHVAAIESAQARDTDPLPSKFAQRVEREATRREFHQAKQQVVIGDGARWIWNLTEELFPRAIQIVDLFHVKQHLWDVAKDIYGSGTELTKQWAGQRCWELDRGQIDAIVSVLKTHADSSAAAKQCIGYLHNNRARMQYAKFRAQKLCVSSGVVEAACKNVIGARLKNGGMHWSVNGANAIIALRCSVLSNRFDDFWERRAG